MPKASEVAHLRFSVVLLEKGILEEKPHMLARSAHLRAEKNPNLVKNIKAASRP